jgi:hypothetical protein
MTKLQAAIKTAAALQKRNDVLEARVEKLFDALVSLDDVFTRPHHSPMEFLLEFLERFNRAGEVINKVAREQAEES